MEYCGKGWQIENIDTGQICFLQAFQWSCVILFGRVFSAARGRPASGGLGAAIWMEWSHYSRWTNSTATLAVIRGEPSPVLIFVRPCRPQPPFQTVLAAGRQGSSRPQVSYTWCGAALTTWAGSLGQLNNNIELAAMQRNHNIFYDITSSALHSIIWYYNYKNVLKAYGIKKTEEMRSVAENL